MRASTVYSQSSRRNTHQSVSTGPFVPVAYPRDYPPLIPPPPLYSGLPLVCLPPAHSRRKRVLEFGLLFCRSAVLVNPVLGNQRDESKQISNVLERMSLTLIMNTDTYFTLVVIYGGCDAVRSGSAFSAQLPWRACPLLATEPLR